MTTATPALRRGRFAEGVRRHFITAYAVLALTYLLLPVAIVILFSFNDKNGKFNFVWSGFTLKYWKQAFGVPGLFEAFLTSLRIALVSSFVATILGTLIALALIRYRYRGRAATNIFIFLPMATPEIVMGASLLTLFVATALPPVAGSVPLLYPTGFHTIVIAHIMFCISFVVVAIKARLAGYDRRLEEAAMDLGATEWTTFWKVTFPLILPGIIAAALLAFSLSIDDFVVTNFVSGTDNTFPIWVYAIQRNALPVQINVVGSIVFLGAVGLVLISSLRSGGIPRLR